MEGDSLCPVLGRTIFSRLNIPSGAAPGPSLPEVMEGQTNPGPGLGDRIPQVQEQQVGVPGRLITECLVPLFFRTSKVTAGNHRDGERALLTSTHTLEDSRSSQGVRVMLRVLLGYL